MVVNNFYVGWPWRPARPFKADSPLVVNANAVLALAVADEGFKTIAGQDGQIAERGSRLKTIKLQARGACKPGKRFDAFSSGKVSRPLVPVADDHQAKLARNYALRQA